MKVKREWNEEEEVFYAITEALEDNDEGIEFISRDETGSYGDRGTITVRIDGRKFQLDLYEID